MGAGESGGRRLAAQRNSVAAGEGKVRARQGRRPGAAEACVARGETRAHLRGRARRRLDLDHRARRGARDGAREEGLGGEYEKCSNLGRAQKVELFAAKEMPPLRFELRTSRLLSVRSAN